MPLEWVALTGALGALKSLTGIAKDVNNIEINQKIVELQQKLLDIQIEYGNLIDENRSLKAEIEAQKATIFHHSVYWKAQPDGTESGPFCPICVGEKKLFIQLKFNGKYVSDQNIIIFNCPIKHDGSQGMRPAAYYIPASLIPEDRYGPRM